MWRNTDKAYLKARRPGFTLMELIVAMGMALIVMAGTTILFSTSNQAYTQQDAVVSAEQNVRATMEIMTHELRMAGYVPINMLPGTAGAPASDVSTEGWSDGTFDRIEYASANRIAFSADLNSDGTVETITYYLQGNTLVRRAWEYSGGAWSEMTTGAAEVIVLADNITALSFVYTFENGVQGIPSEVDATTTNDREDIRAVTIAVTGRTRIPTKGGNYRFRTLRSYIKMRNLGLETTAI